MKPCLAASGPAAGALLLARSPLGVRRANRVRALSDQARLGFVRATSEFESEPRTPPAEVAP
jgi:hypothetical protein